MMMKSPNVQRCPFCNNSSPFLDVDTGELVCTNPKCGKVISEDRESDGPEWR